MGLPFFGIIPTILLVGVLFLLFRAWRGSGGSQSGNRQSPMGTDFRGMPRTSAPEVFRLAKRYTGVLTVSDVVSELGLGPDDAEHLLDSLTDGRRIVMDVDNEGVVRYIFPEFQADRR